MAGAGYKLFTTGQVLTAAEVNTYLQEQTVMVFNDAASRTTALSGVLAEGMVSYLKSTKVVEIYNGTAWASLDDPNAIQNTIVDAKGDLIAATGNDVPARLAVGSDGSTLVADSSATTGLRWTAGNVIANPIINSSFQIWQRGTSVAVAASTGITYTADRWWTSTGANQAITVSRQLTSDTTNLPFIQYCARYQRNSGQTGTGVLGFAQPLESINSVQFAGKPVTLSFYARAGSNFSAASSALGVFAMTGTGTDQNGSGAYTGAVGFVDTNVTLTTTWQRFTFTATLPTNTNEIFIQTKYTPVGTASTNDFYEITGVQLDIGSVALPFRTNGATLAGELAACQRYCYVINGSTSVPANFNAAYYTSTRVFAVVQFPVTMRSTPSTTISSQTMATVYSNGGNRASTAIAESDRSIQTGMLDITTAATTAGHACMISFVTASTSITWSAEL